MSWTQSVAAGTWRSVLELHPDRSIASGSPAALCEAVRRGADLRIYTEFRHNEHIDTASNSRELIQEFAEFRCTYLVENRWTAAAMTLRQPIQLPDGFGPRPSMSFFLYNQDGRQAIARPHLDRPPQPAPLGPSPPEAQLDMPRYHEQDRWDAQSNAPSSNFVYEFDVFRYFVNEKWQEVYAHTADGDAVSGSLAALHQAFEQGREVKLAIQAACADLADDPRAAPDHELIIQAGPCYHYTERNLFIAGSHPVVRVRPAIPLQYTTRGWDFGWLLARTDGLVEQLLYDPYTLTPRRSGSHHAIRWFVC